MSAEDGAPGRREVAHRLFAAEFDDATVSYRESDEERAPNYVVTPTGARVNRLFAVGVLTEVESVNDDVVRARVADPTGAFVSYAGQYQPDALAFYERTDPPAFVALTGKARTFEPDDGDRVYSSVRPESVNAVDAETRDRWVVSAAEATLDRVALFEAALAADARGDALRDRLAAAGYREALAAGIPLAIERYGTTHTYLEALRQRAVEALELVAGDREAVESLAVAPDEGGPAALGPTPSPAPVGDGEVASLDAVGDDTATERDEPTASEEAVGAADEAADAADATERAPTATGGSGDGTAKPADEPPEPDDGTSGTPDVAEGITATDDAVGDAASSDVASSDAATEDSDGPSVAESSGDELGDFEPSDADDGVEQTGAAGDALGDFEPSDADDGGEQTGAAGDELGDFEPSDADDGGEQTGAAGDELGDFEGGAGETAADAETDPDEMYELDEAERREVEEEFGTEFSTGTEIDDPGSADIDVPDAEDVVEGPSTAETSGADDAPTAEETADSGVTGADAATDESADEKRDDTSDVDLESAVVSAMDELDDGDGATREAVVTVVVDRHGAAPDAVEDAIQDALMSGLCYEPNEDSLKAI